MSRVALVLALSGLLVGACHRGKKDGSTCEQAGAAFVALGHAQLAAAEQAGETDAKTRATVESHVPAMRDSMVRACKEGGWSAESRGCFAAAKDDAAMMSCYQTLAPAQQALLEQGYSQPKR